MQELCELSKRCRHFIAPYLVTDGKGFKLADYAPDDLNGLTPDKKKKVQEKLEQGIAKLEELQSVLYASEAYSLLIILQAMDAAGKDGIIKHVMTGVNPQGCRVSSFKQPSALELRHDFLWRCTKELPARGMIGIFNRSYYEEVLSVKVHPEYLQAEGLPAEPGSGFWKERYASIRHLEQHLYANKTRMVKIFLNLSEGEQRRRLLARLDVPEKNWKFSEADIKERSSWKAYQDAFEEMIRRTATKEAPWLVVPADNKWFSRIVCLCAIVDALGRMKLQYPQANDAVKALFPAFREALGE